MSAWTLTSLLKKRMRLIDTQEADGSLDLLITGCEVSLWMGEQFHSDLHRIFPKLKIATISANKLLGQLGQTFPIPQLNFPFHDDSLDLRQTPCLLVTHSGGTFATLACSNLLKSYTEHIFCITSEWDTQVASSIRKGRGAQKQTISFNSYVFVTHVGLRPAEACTISVVATHQVLTQILLYIMYYLRHFEVDGEQATTAGSSYCRQEVQELAELNEANVMAVKDIIGDVFDPHDQSAADGTNAASKQDGVLTVTDTATSKKLRDQGRHWAQHILEGPISWIISAIYIVVTVVLHATPLSVAYAAGRESVVGSSGGAQSPSPSSLNETMLIANASHVPLCTDDLVAGTVCLATAGAPTSSSRYVYLEVLDYVISVIDAAIYIFLPIWTTWLIRIWQGRPWLHRVSGRSLLIGDIPYVSQAVEAYVSKLFALSYSIATISVSSGNPTDHLVHRHTHRVVRGSLLAVGRPDGRLNALTSAENTVSLSLSQASSIQNFGVTCESISVGHNPSKLSLSAEGLILPGRRPMFLCEREYELRRRVREARAEIKVQSLDDSRHSEDSRLSEEDSFKKRAGVTRADFKRLSAAQSAAQSNGFENGMSASALLGAMDGMFRDDSGGDARSLALQTVISDKEVIKELKSSAQKQAVFRRIMPLKQPFLGAWMGELVHGAGTIAAHAACYLSQSTQHNLRSESAVVTAVPLKAETNLLFCLTPLLFLSSRSLRLLVLTASHANTDACDMWACHHCRHNCEVQEDEHVRIDGEPTVSSDAVRGPLCIDATTCVLFRNVPFHGQSCAGLLAARVVRLAWLRYEPLAVDHAHSDHCVAGVWHGGS